MTPQRDRCPHGDETGQLLSSSLGKAMAISALALVVALALWPSLDEPPNLSDEGYLLCGAHRVQAHQLPGADFHAYMPVRYLIAALVSPSSPVRVLQLRFLEHLLITGACTLLAIVLMKITAGQVAAALLVLGPVVLYPGPWHKASELLITVLAALALTALAGRPGRRTVAWIGAAVGLVLVTRMELGLAIGAVVLSSVVLRRRSLVPVLAATAALPVAATSLLYLCRGRLAAAGTFYGQELLASLGIRSSPTNPFLGAPSPAGSELVSAGVLPASVLVTIAVMLASGVGILTVRGRRNHHPALWLHLVALAAIRLLPLCNSFDASHLLQGLPAAYLPVAVVPGRKRRLVALLVLALVHLTVAVQVGDPYYRGRWSAAEPVAGGSIHPLLAGIKAEEHLAATVRAVQQEVNGGRSTMVAVPYAPLLVALSGGHNPTRSDFYFPNTRAAVALEESLASPVTGPQWILLDGNALMSESSFSLRGDRHQLGQTIRRHSTLVSDLGQWLLLRRRPDGAEAAGSSLHAVTRGSR